MPDLSNVVEAEKFWVGLSKEQKDYSILVARATKADKLPFGVEGFSHFYWCGTRHELPPYARDYWVPALIEAWEKQGSLNN